ARRDLGSTSGWRPVRGAGPASRVRAHVDLPRRSRSRGARGAVAPCREGVRGGGRRGCPLFGVAGHRPQRVGPGVRLARFRRVVVRAAPWREVALSGVAAWYDHGRRAAGSNDTRRLSLDSPRGGLVRTHVKILGWLQIALGTLDLLEIGRASCRETVVDPAVAAG